MRSTSSPHLLCGLLLGLVLLGCDGKPTVELASGLSSPNLLFVDEVHVYWTQYDEARSVFSLHRAPKVEPGTVERLEVFEGPAPRGVTWDADTVYVVRAGDILRVPRSLGAPSVLTTLEAAQAQAPASGFGGAATVDGSHVYWYAPEAAGELGRIFRVPRE